MPGINGPNGRPDCWQPGGLPTVRAQLGWLRLNWLRPGWLVLAFFALLAGPDFPAAGFGFAQAAPGPAPGQEQVMVKVLENNGFTISKDLTIVKGKILIRKGEIEIVGDALEYDSKRQVAILTGNVKLSKPDFTMAGQKFTADFQKENYVMEGNVILEQKEKDRRGSAAAAVYDQERETLELTGGVVIEQKDGERLKGEKVRIAIEKDELEVIGPVEAEFPVKKNN